MGERESERREQKNRREKEKLLAFNFPIQNICLFVFSYISLNTINILIILKIS